MATIASQTLRTIQKNMDIPINDSGNDGRIRPQDIQALQTTTLVALATLTIDDDLILCNGTFTVTLPAISGVPGKVYYIKNIGTGTITIDTTSSETIDGALTQTLAAQYDSYTLCNDGTSWFLI